MSLGTIDYAGSQWDVVSFTGSREGFAVVVSPMADQTPAWVIAGWFAESHASPDGEIAGATKGEFITDAHDLLSWLSARGYAVVATRNDRLGKATP